MSYFFRQKPDNECRSIAYEWCLFIIGYWKSHAKVMFGSIFSTWFFWLGNTCKRAMHLLCTSWPQYALPQGGREWSKESTTSMVFWPTCLCILLIYAPFNQLLTGKRQSKITPKYLSQIVNYFFIKCFISNVFSC